MSALDEQAGGDHYRRLSPQPIEVIRAWGLGFEDGNVLKYLARWRYKGGAGDLRKARHYLDLLIEELERNPAWADAGAWVRPEAGRDVPPKDVADTSDGTAGWGGPTQSVNDGQ